MNDDSFREPELVLTADRVRNVLQSGGIRPEFSQWLRARLVAEAAARVAPAVDQTVDLSTVSNVPLRPYLVPVPAPAPEPVPVPAAPAAGPGEGNVVPIRRPARHGRGRRVVAWAASATAAAAASAAVLVGVMPSLLQTGNVLVQASSSLTGAVSADPGGQIKLTFNQALDHASTEAALRLSPATAVRTSWEGDTLVVTPEHGLAPNSPYLLTVDARTARTAKGSSLAADLQLGFGTASATAAGPAVTPSTLQRVMMASATQTSEAVVTKSDSLLVTAAQLGTGTALVRMQGKTGEATLGGATEAICVSRSGKSVAFLGKTTTGTGIVFANAEGTPVRTVDTTVDAGSPLGWIDDDEVTYVSRGKLVATDRQGRQRSLWSQPVDARQNLVVAPGSRYVFLGNGPAGRLIDLTTGTARTLSGLAAAPAFTADGAGLVWIDVLGGAVRVHYGPSSGGPSTSAVLPAASTDTISELAVAPDATQFVYSLVSGGRGELRLAGLPTGVTLATSAKGIGESPNFAPSGQFFTVLTTAAGQHRIETVKVPKAPTAGELSALRLTAARAVATAFATAQVGADSGAQAWLAKSGLTPPPLPRLTRAALLWSVAAEDGVVTARVRLTSDPQASRAYPVQAEETLTIAPAAAGTLPKVSTVEVGKFAAAPAGPQVLRVTQDAAAGEIAVMFDSDLDVASVRSGIKLTAADGATVSATIRYDAATRTTMLRPAGSPQGILRISVGGVHDIRGTAAAPVGVLEARLA